MTFWVLVIFMGLFGALADVSLNQWSKILSPRWWIISSILFLVFMTGFGLAMRLGATRGYSLTIAVVIVLLLDIVAVGIWDFVVGGTWFTPTQWFGVALAILAMLCFELGKK